MSEDKDIWSFCLKMAKRYSINAIQLHNEISLELKMNSDMCKKGIIEPTFTKQ